MVTYFVAFLCALAVSTVLTVFVRNVAVERGWVDQARSSRKIHLKPIPRLGGVAIVLGFFAPLTALLLVDSGVGYTFKLHPELIVGLFTGGLAIAALGLYDDFKGSGAKKKFVVQCAVALGLYALGFRIDSIANPFGETLALGPLALPFTVLWIVGVINALNLIDGLDGLAGGVAFFGVATNLILALARGDVLLSLMMASLAGAVLGFLVFNFNPASIFMGDTGSMFLGFVLAAVSIKTSAKSGTAVAMLVPVMALGLPIMDTLLAMIRRTMMGRPVFSADKEHIHHRLMSRLFLSHRRAVLMLYGLATLFGLTALALAFANSTQTALLLCAMGTVVFVLMRKLGYLNLAQAKELTELRRRNLQLRTVVRGLTDAIRGAHSHQQLWELVRPIAEALNLSQLKLKVETQREDSREGVIYETTRPVGGALPLELCVPLRHRERHYGHMQLAWSDGRGEVDRDEELAIELIADVVAEAAARIEAESEADSRVVALRK